MILTDDAIDLYSRHVLLPEIGPRGQARLLATRVTIGGPPLLRTAVADLLRRGGLQVVSTDGHVAIALGRAFAPASSRACLVGWSSDTSLHVTTLAGRPCIACWPPPGGGAIPTETAEIQALAALVATVATLHAVAEEVPSSCEVELCLDPPAMTTRTFDTPGCRQCLPSTPESR